MTTQLGARMFANPRTGATVHIYVAPPDGLFVTSHFVETEHEPQPTSSVRPGSIACDSLIATSFGSGVPVSQGGGSPEV